MTRSIQDSRLSYVADVLARRWGPLVITYVALSGFYFMAFFGLGPKPVENLLHAFYQVPTGMFIPWTDLANEADPAPAEALVYILGIFFVSQGVFIWTCHWLSKAQEPPQRRKIVLPSLIITFLGSTLIASLTMAGAEFAFHAMDVVEDTALMVVWAGGGALVITIALVYGGRYPYGPVLSFMTAALFAAGWVGFCVALPIDIAAKLHPSSGFLNVSGSSIALHTSLLAMIWAGGPALYLLRRRRNSTDITESGTTKDVSKYVSSARIYSLAIILLGYVGWELGLQNSGRFQKFTEAANLLTKRWVADQWPSWDDLAAEAESGNPIAQTKTGFFFATKTGFHKGVEKASPIGAVKLFLKGDSGSLEAEVSGPFGDWKTGPFRFNDPRERLRLNELMAKENINRNQSDLEILLIDFRQSYFHKEIAVPGIQFRAIEIDIAIWIVVVASLLILIIVRNRLAIVLHDSRAGAGEPWLVLDARTGVEKVVAALWLFGILAAGWLVTMGLLLTESETYKGMADPPVAGVGLTLVAILGLMVSCGWVSFTVVADILRLRAVRQNGQTT